MSESFSSRLSEAIASSPLTQREIARISGITAPYLSDLKSGKKANPSREIIDKLAGILEVSPARLLIIPGESSLEENIPKPPPRRSDDPFYQQILDSLVLGASVCQLVAWLSEYLERERRGDPLGKTMVDAVIKEMEGRFPQKPTDGNELE